MIGSRSVDRARAKNGIAVDPHSPVGDLETGFLEDRSNGEPNELPNGRLLDFGAIFSEQISLTAETGGRDCFAAPIRAFRADLRVSRIDPPFASAVAARSARRMGLVITLRSPLYGCMFVSCCTP